MFLKLNLNFNLNPFGASYNKPQHTQPARPAAPHQNCTHRSEPAGSTPIAYNTKPLQRFHC